MLSPRERTAFVGRERELEVLRARVAAAPAPAAAASSCVAGEPGIGKTRLASEFAREAHDRGTVLYAGCQEEALVSYQPFVEALRHFARSTGCDWAAVARPRAPRELARLDPRARRRAAGAAGRVAPAIPQTRRYLLFDAVSALLAEVVGARAAACSSSTTCTGPTAPRCTCCATSSGRRRRRRC